MPNANARRLRTEMTVAERRLWGLLRGRRLQSYKFRRQHPVGRFIADFACIEHKLIAEADGGQHAESASDLRRTAFLVKEGWRLVRFWNNEILSNPHGVAETIWRELARKG